MPKERSFDDVEPIGSDDDFSAEEQAALDRMANETPMPAPEEESEPSPSKAQASADDEQDEGGADDESDDEEGDDEAVIDEEGRARGKDGKFVVPKSALLRVKEQNKKTRGELEQQRAENARIIGRMQILTDIINSAGDGKQPQQQQKAPDNPWDEPDVNPAEDLMGALEQERRRNKYERAQRESMQQRHSSRETETALVQSYVADAKRIAAENIRKGEVIEVDGKQIPAFSAAYQYLVGLRHAQLEAVGIEDVNERTSRIAAEEKQLVEAAAANKRSGAEAIYKLAVASGFKMPTKADPKAPISKTPAQMQAERKVDTINRGQQSQQSLSGKGGKAYGGLTPSQIIAMDDGAFDNFVNGLSESQLNRLLGAD